MAGVDYRRTSTLAFVEEGSQVDFGRRDKARNRMPVRGGLKTERLDWVVSFASALTRRREDSNYTRGFPESL